MTTGYGHIQFLQRYGDLATDSAKAWGCGERLGPTDDLWLGHAATLRHGEG